MKRKALYSALIISMFPQWVIAETVPATVVPTHQQRPPATGQLEKLLKKCLSQFRPKEYWNVTASNLRWTETELSGYVGYIGTCSGDSIWGPFTSERAADYWVKLPWVCSAGDLPGGRCLTCPDSSWIVLPDRKTCYRPDPEEYANAGPASCGGKNASSRNQFVGNPINASVGNKIEQDIDLPAPAASPELMLVRTYNSRYLPSSIGTAYPWTTNFHRYALLSNHEEQETVQFIRGNGQITTFRKSSSGDWQAISSTNDKVTEIQDANGVRTGWRYQNTDDDDVEHYNQQGQLTNIEKKTGRRLTLTYSDGTPAGGYAQDDLGNISDQPLPAGLLVQVTNTLGHTLSFVYNERSQLLTAQGAENNKVYYRYDLKQNLTQIRRSDHTTRQYLYENASYPTALTGIINELGQRTLTVTYDDKGRATSTEHADGVNKYQVTYDSEHSASVTDPLGTTRQYSFTTINGAIKTTSLSQPCPTGCGQSGKHTDYDAQGNPVRLVDWNGTVTEYTYDPTRGLELRRTEGLQDQGGSSIVQPETRTIVTRWHATYTEPLTISEYTGGVNASGQPTGALQKQTVYTYDNQGNPLTRTETSGTDSRQWKYQYGSLGRMTSATDPDGVSVQYTYYPDNDADLGKRGQLKQSTNNAAHITQVTDYTADGHPSRIVDPNGKVTELTYDTRGRVTSQQTGNQHIDYTYDAAGQLTLAQGNDGTRLNYGYDNAGRLISVSDHKGNRIDYTLDNLGNRLSETVSGPGGAQLKQIERQYTPLNQLKQISGNQ